MTDSLINILTRGVVDADARGNGRNHKRKKKNGNNGGVRQQIQARCVGQIPACETLALDCDEDDGVCQAAIRACCQSLATCQFTEFFICASAASGAGS